ncbi:MAG TPA: GTPase domain-containing protein [Gemmataceae bacterium]|nr:GTPase domain-containing protein [Gemmataceae bacterium]
MEPLSARALIGQLGDDLGWLEDHCRHRPDQATAAVRLRLAAGLVRNCIGPAIDDQPPTPLHVVVMGGAGAGKSTVANLLSGAQAAESNPQAGFTRHPIAYTNATGALSWAGHVGFLGPLQRLTNPAPASLDEDVYQVRRVPADPTTYDLLKDFVVWDCPDMTTWAAAGYIPRLLEAAALADVIVFVASDERYNDEVPTRFLKLILEAGKAVVIVLTKMREADAAPLIAHFQQEVVSRLPHGVVGCYAIPFLTPDQLADPARQAGKYRIPILNQVAVLGNPPATARRRSVFCADRYLVQGLNDLLSVARTDLDALEGWQAMVQTGRNEFVGRYNREYLNSEKFRGFDEALVRLMELLELPAFGRILSGALWVLRTPYRLVRGLLMRMLSRPEAISRAEQPVLEDAYNGWIDGLRKETARRAESHPLWAHLSQAFHSGGLTEQARDRFQQSMRTFQSCEAEEVDRTARDIYEQLQKRPVALYALRGGKFALDVAAVSGSILAGGIGWQDFIIAPLVASLTHQLVELLGWGVVDAQREKARSRQQQLLKQHLSEPMAEWLTKWPATGGSSFERLQQALGRIPGLVQQLDTRVRALKS